MLKCIERQLDSPPCPAPLHPAPAPPASPAKGASGSGRLPQPCNTQSVSSSTSDTGRTYKEIVKAEMKADIYHEGWGWGVDMQICPGCALAPSSLQDCMFYMCVFSLSVTVNQFTDCETHFVKCVYLK